MEAKKGSGNEYGTVVVLALPPTMQSGNAQMALIASLKRDVPGILMGIDLRGMHLKSFVSALIVFAVWCLPASAQQYDLNKFLGTYASNSNQDYVFVKGLTIAKDDKGKVKFRATLSGFPDDLSLGEATGEQYTARNIDVYKSYLATFTTSKLSVFMVISTNASHPEAVSITSYMKYPDGGKGSVYFDGSLQKEPEKPAK